MRISTLVLCILPLGMAAQNVGINATGAAPNAAAMLDVASTTAGVLIPRMTAAQRLAIAAPVAGLLVYQTNATAPIPANHFWYYDGTEWRALFTDRTGWSIWGNAGTVANNNFLGTTDDVALRIRTNNVQRFEFTNTGELRSFANGTAAAPAYGWTANVGTGIFQQAANAIGFTTNGTERLRIPNANQLHAMANGTAALPFYSWQANTNTGIFRATTNSMGFSTGGVQRVRMGDYAGSVGFNRVPRCGQLGGPLVDIAQPLEVGNDGMTGLQARIGYWYGGTEVAIDPETNMFGYVGYINRAWWAMYSYSYNIASQRSLKRDITPVNNDKGLEHLIMEDIDRLRPSLYYMIAEHEMARSPGDAKYRPHYRLGVIVDEAPDYTLNPDLSSVDIYALASLSIAGVKHNNTRIQELESMIERNSITDHGSISTISNEVKVAFSNGFVEDLNGMLPVVNLTPIGTGAADLRIVSKSADGFTVRNMTGEGMAFDWLALAKVDRPDGSPRSRVPHAVERSIRDRMHLPASVKQEVIDHYNKIQVTATPAE